MCIRIICVTLIEPSVVTEISELSTSYYFLRCLEHYGVIGLLMTREFTLNDLLVPNYIV